MSSKYSDENIDDLFKLHPVKAAKVSEISEATASSSLLPEERVNFHIGNPVQDPRLEKLYLSMILNFSSGIEDDNEIPCSELLNKLGWDNEKIEWLKLLRKSISKSNPYMPKGGFHKSNPNDLIKYFLDWLCSNQQEPLFYDLGDKTGVRECSITSGGLYESLRIFFHALSVYLIIKPAKIFLYECNFPTKRFEYQELEFEKIDSDETVLVSKLNNVLKTSQDKPLFLVLGKNIQEETRRSLRQLSINNPLFFIETNNAPNHLSLAREAKLQNRIIRFLTPQVFKSFYKESSIVFVAGNADFINILETIHFQLKGTPSATEVELLDYMVKNYQHGKSELHQDSTPDITLDESDRNQFLEKSNLLADYSKHFSNTISKRIQSEKEIVDGQIKRVTEFVEHVSNSLSLYVKEYFPTGDHFLSVSTEDILDEFFRKFNTVEFHKKLEESFLTVFVENHTEYSTDYSSVVSGSARTALSLIGFHCGIKEVVTCDLSWTYEHCFPEVSFIPLDENLDLDVNKIISYLENKIADDPGWNKHGTVILNNPHNASGKIFSESKLKPL
ncbi:hypothetical protein ACFLS9_09775, partial [Bacteroidota bacterium]